ncbi:LAGLIDADG family homing endonuclease, partial [Candidatus Woesearchaeota archaeon]|nr:LAGLIDADG family homing endonuclease [Candidatus Woesearchaeota archaeon]
IREDTLDYIFADDALALPFIAAFWDAEGTVRKQGNYFHIYLYNTNFRLIERIREFLGARKITSSILSRRTRDRSAVLKGHLVVSRKMLYRISVPKSSLLQWVQLIGKGMHHSKKSAAVKEIMKLHGGN